MLRGVRAYVHSALEWYSNTLSGGAVVNAKRRFATVSVTGMIILLFYRGDVPFSLTIQKRSARCDGIILEETGPRLMI